MVGTDFSLIGQLFPHRARAEIKVKIKTLNKAVKRLFSLFSFTIPMLPISIDNFDANWLCSNAFLILTTSWKQVSETLICWVEFQSTYLINLAYLDTVCLNFILIEECC